MTNSEISNPLTFTLTHIIDNITTISVPRNEIQIKSDNPVIDIIFCIGISGFIFGFGMSFGKFAFKSIQRIYISSKAYD